MKTANEWAHLMVTTTLAIADTHGDREWALEQWLIASNAYVLRIQADAWKAGAEEMRSAILTRYTDDAIQEGGIATITLTPTPEMPKDK